jgi:hypothetical protein
MKKLLLTLIVISFFCGCSGLQVQRPDYPPIPPSKLEELVSKSGANVVRAFTCLTGGTTGCLDKIEYGSITAGDIAMVVTGNIIYFFQYNAADPGSESSPTYICPDNASDCSQGAWNLVTARVAGLNTGRTAAPEFSFYDSDCTDSDVNGKIYLNCATDTSSGSEDCDLYFQVQQAGTLTTKIQIAAGGKVIFPDGGINVSAAEGITLQNSETITNADDTEVAINGTESIAFDLDTGTANQVIIKNKTTGSTAVDDLYSTIPFRAPAKFVSYSADQTLTAAAHNGALVEFTAIVEATMWDCTSSTIGHMVTLWARDAEKIEVVPASGDQFYLFDGTGIGANDELDMAATAGTKVTLMCTAADEWRVVFETAACADGGAAD